MPLVTQDGGELLMLGWILRDTTTPENLTLKLYSNAYTPVASSTTGNFTESAFTGYSAKTLTRASWGAPSTVSGKASSTYGSVQTWTCGATGGTVNGYFVVGATSGTLLFAEQFASARTLANGDVLNLTPVFTLNSEN